MYVTISRLKLEGLTKNSNWIQYLWYSMTKWKVVVSTYTLKKPERTTKVVYSLDTVYSHKKRWWENEREREWALNRNFLNRKVSVNIYKQVRLHWFLLYNRRKFDYLGHTRMGFSKITLFFSIQRWVRKGICINVAGRLQSYWELKRSWWHHYVGRVAQLVAPYVFFFFFFFNQWINVQQVN